MKHTQRDFKETKRSAGFIVANARDDKLGSEAPLKHAQRELDEETLKLDKAVEDLEDQREGFQRVTKIINAMDSRSSANMEQELDAISELKERYPWYYVGHRILNVMRAKILGAAQRGGSPAPEMAQAVVERARTTIRDVLEIADPKQKIRQRLGCSQAAETIDADLALLKKIMQEIDKVLWDHSDEFAAIQKFLRRMEDDLFDDDKDQDDLLDELEETYSYDVCTRIVAAMRKKISDKAEENMSTSNGVRVMKQMQIKEASKQQLERQVKAMTQQIQQLQTSSGEDIGTSGNMVSPQTRHHVPQ